MNVRVIEIGPARVACLRYTGPFGPALGEFWRDVVAPWLQANGLMGRVTYGVALDDPQHTPPEQCRYDACVEIGHDDTAPPPATLRRARVGSGPAGTGCRARRWPTSRASRRRRATPPPGRRART